jgi:hypothetical protein
MDYDRKITRYEASRAYNPWDDFKNRTEKNHRAEDTSRLFSPSDPEPTSSKVIDVFLKQNAARLDELVPQRWQLLRDFLNEVARHSASGTDTYSVDVDKYNTDSVLLDDRRKHDKCTKDSLGTCAECHIFSKELNISALRRRLFEQVSYSPKIC